MTRLLDEMRARPTPANRTAGAQARQPIGPRAPTAFYTPPVLHRPFGQAREAADELIGANADAAVRARKPRAGK